MSVEEIENKIKCIKSFEPAESYLQEIWFKYRYQEIIQDIFNSGLPEYKMQALFNKLRG